MDAWTAASHGVARAARTLEAELGAPRLALVLGSGFAPLAGMLGCGSPIPLDGLDGFPVPAVEGHGADVAAAPAAAGPVWVFSGRCHLHEGRSPVEVVHAIRVAAEAGAEAVLLTFAAGGLAATDRPGDFALVSDHVNLTGVDPVGSVPPSLRRPAFPDLQELYDPVSIEAVDRAARARGAGPRIAILAQVRGPCFETPAEVRMIRTLGADLVSMSVAVEATMARYLGLRVAAVGCIANRAAGLAAGPIEHGAVVTAVSDAVRVAAWLVDAVRAVAGLRAR